MGEKLIDLVAKKLLEKFGSGMHKPGSGSASAFQGMLSAQLLLTVIDLTNQLERREKYKEKLVQLLNIGEDIKLRLFPALEILFQEDSDHFDKVINLRRARDAATRSKDWILHQQKVAAADDALKTATDLPVRIAQICSELGKHAGEVFDHGFQSARGDSGVALQCAIAGIGSCLSIIELNLTKLSADAWMTQLRSQKAELKVRFIELSALGIAKLAILEEETEKNWQSEQTFAMYRLGILGKTIRTDQDMEKLVRDLQNKLWIERDQIWRKGITTDAMKVINPRDVLQKVLGYTFIQSESLGVHAIGDEIYEVAGVIDKNQKRVSISKNFPQEIMNFTAAHELGHVILHEQTIMHRDRPFDGGSTAMLKDPLEQQADKFAAYFLMPGKVVKDIFYEMFDTEIIGINEAVVLALVAGSRSALRAKCKDQRGFAMLIAQTELYGGKTFYSLAKIFGVSPGAMAIRLMELSLVKF
jgi:formiminotetrahydrofolate cyclodeaminase